jgi:phosphatidylinositol alpha-1,6-mannosyltransferase
MPYVRYYAARIAPLYYVRRILSDKYDWVMIFFAGYGEAESLRIARMLRPQKYCIVFHFPYEQVPHRYEEFKRFRCAKDADLLVAVSKYVASGVREVFRRACAVVYNGTDTEKFAPSEALRVGERMALGIADRTPILITLAALEERKGIQWVIRAIPLLLDHYPDLQYHVLGDGDYRKDLEDLVSELNLHNHVKMLGNSTNVVRALAAADVGCLLSSGEGLPIAALEYMSMALPYVASRRPPFDEIVSASYGIAVDESNSREVARAIDMLLSNHKMRQAMGRSGRQCILENYTWKVVAREYLALLQGV